MKDILKRLETVSDPRQQCKVKHSIKDIVGIVLFATLANANEWTEIILFAEENEDFLKQYLDLPNGIPSHDTLSRVMGIIDPKFMQSLYLQWNTYINTNEGEKIKKILNIDGKTMRGSGNVNQKALHVVSVWSDADGISLGQKVVDEKSNEIIAIPELLEEINIKGSIVTIDAMGTQVKIAEQIKKQKGNYVLAVKGNQGNLYEEIKTYFEDEEELKQIKEAGGYKRTAEKARSQIEVREYYQTAEIGWMEEKKRWKGLKSIGMVQNTITKSNGEKVIERRYYITSEPVDIEIFAKSCRGHWAIESMHWHLDVTFKEDSNKILEKTANENLTIIRRWALGILKTVELSTKKSSLKAKRYRICMNPQKHIRKIMEV